MAGNTEATLCVCGSTCVETATPSKCGHLFVANWEHARRDNGPPAILRLTRRQLTDLVLLLPTPDGSLSSLEDGARLCLV